MRSKILMLPLIGVSSCAIGTSDAAFCGPDFTGVIERLADALPDPQTPDAVGKAGAAVVLGHDAGCA
ncbi:hypothetical protein [Sulfitobacter dubius]|uniref:Lipoprotein n=1 Tax=Sulfitobacter dubius TaxID=218673 RepID=A0ABY3ZK67_9RHOB|nr:hypothetical protein [Sulfitobacter dubius]UOA14544.1 hypothetical protein DSM109990_01350 [Sulfitobacter dubius]